MKLFTPLLCILFIIGLSSNIYAQSVLQPGDDSGGEFRFCDTNNKGYVKDFSYNYEDIYNGSKLIQKVFSFVYPSTIKKLDIGYLRFKDTEINFFGRSNGRNDACFSKDLDYIILQNYCNNVVLDTRDFKITDNQTNIFPIDEAGMELDNGKLKYVVGNCLHLYGLKRTKTINDKAFTFIAPYVNTAEETYTNRQCKKIWTLEYPEGKKWRGDVMSFETMLQEFKPSNSTWTINHKMDWNSNVMREKKVYRYVNTAWEDYEWSESDLGKMADGIIDWPQAVLSLLKTPKIIFNDFVIHPSHKFVFILSTLGKGNENKMKVGNPVMNIMMIEMDSTTKEFKEKILATLPGHNSSPERMIISQSGNLLISHSKTENILWYIERKEITAFKLPIEGMPLVIDPTDKYLLVENWEHPKAIGGVLVYDLEKGILVNRDNSSIRFKMYTDKARDYISKSNIVSEYDHDVDKPDWSMILAAQFNPDNSVIGLTYNHYFTTPSLSPSLYSYWNNCYGQTSMLIDFNELIDPNIEASTSSKPKGLSDYSLEELNDQLSTAIKNEDFNRAAELNKEIRKRKGLD